MALFWIKSGRWLVNNHQARIARDGLRKSKSLTHAAGISTHLALGRARQIHALKKRLRNFSTPARAINALQLQHQLQHAQTSQVWKKAKILRQIAKLAAHNARVLHNVRAIKRDGARRWFKQTRKRVHKRALAGAVGTKQTKQALANIQRHALQRVNGTGINFYKIVN